MTDLFHHTANAIFAIAGFNVTPRNTQAQLNLRQLTNAPNNSPNHCHKLVFDCTYGASCKLYIKHDDCQCILESEAYLWYNGCAHKYKYKRGSDDA